VAHFERNGGSLSPEYAIWLSLTTKQKKPLNKNAAGYLNQRH